MRSVTGVNIIGFLLSIVHTCACVCHSTSSRSIISPLGAGDGVVVVVSTVVPAFFVPFIVLAPPSSSRVRAMFVLLAIVGCSFLLCRASPAFLFVMSPTPTCALRAISSSAFIACSRLTSKSASISFLRSDKPCSFLRSSVFHSLSNLHEVLWMAFQCKIWHALLQYCLCLHPPHLLNSSGFFSTASHRWLEQIRCPFDKRSGPLDDWNAKCSIFLGWLITAWWHADLMRCVTFISESR
mmetsp:Transcript_26154/g.51155  ORF Transcript_26154/g.51155 Transcript_26154/m.51155 type:complete len:239 (-) Transcript_26154:396-1112(-)